MNHQEISKLPDLSSTTWINYLPPVNGMEILTFGNAKVANLKLLLRLGPKSITCIGDKRFELDTDLLNYSEAIENIEGRDFDLCVLDDFDFFKGIRSVLSFKKFITNIFDLLKDSGIF